MPNCYETQGVGKTNIGNHVAAMKKGFICPYTILAEVFFHIHMAILSYFHRQNPGYLKGRLLCNMLWPGKFAFIFFLGKGTYAWNF